MQKEKAAASASGTASVASAKAPGLPALSESEKEPEKKTAEWSWLEDGRQKKIEEKKAHRQRRRKKSEAPEEGTAKGADETEAEAAEDQVQAEDHCKVAGDIVSAEPIQVQ